MSEFGKYGKYYRALNSQKNYGVEVDAIIEIVSMYGDKVQSVADLGCGTGEHLSLGNKLGATVGLGVDISEEMLAEATKSYSSDTRLSFCCDDITNFHSQHKFDLITSLFHVVSYINDYDSLEKFFRRVSEHLESNALLIFDYWSASGVITNGVKRTSRTAQLDEFVVARTARSEMRELENIVDVNFEFEISSQDELIDSFSEVHSMRYYSAAELIYFAGLAGLSHVTTFDSMDIGTLSNEAWASTSVFRTPSLDSFSVVFFISNRFSLGSIITHRSAKSQFPSLANLYLCIWFFVLLLNFVPSLTSLHSMKVSY